MGEEPEVAQRRPRFSLLRRYFHALLVVIQRHRDRSRAIGVGLVTQGPVVLLAIGPDDRALFGIESFAGRVCENWIEIVADAAGAFDVNGEDVGKIALLLRRHFGFDAVGVEETKRRPAIGSRVSK